MIIFLTLSSICLPVSVSISLRTIHLQGLISWLSCLRCCCCSESLTSHHGVSSTSFFFLSLYEACITLISLSSKIFLCQVSLKMSSFKTYLNGKDASRARPSMHQIWWYLASLDRHRKHWTLLCAHLRWYPSCTNFSKYTWCRRKILSQEACPIIVPWLAGTLKAAHPWSRPRTDSWQRSLGSVEPPCDWPRFGGGTT